MQLTGMFIFLLVWLLILWIGSMALEATGMERAKARFQALSALSGTGFTTREAEGIVNHPKRRRIASWLIFLGSVGLTSFLVFAILYVRAGIAAPTLTYIVVLACIVVFFILLIWTGIIGKLTTGILKLLRKSPINFEILHEADVYGVARIKITDKDLTVGKFIKGKITVLAIERGDVVITSPKDTESLKAGDYLLCYGKTEEFNS